MTIRAVWYGAWHDVRLRRREGRLNPGRMACPETLAILRARDDQRYREFVDANLRLMAASLAIAYVTLRRPFKRTA